MDAIEKIQFQTVTDILSNAFKLMLRFPFLANNYIVFSNRALDL